MIGYDKERKTYFVQYKYKDPLSGKWHTKKKRGFKLKREASEYEATLKLNQGTKENISSSVTFKEIVRIWEDTVESSSESRRQHKEHFEKRFADYLNKPIKNITHAQMIAWRIQLGKTEYATKTKNMCLSYVRSVFKFASEIYGIQNPTASLKNFKPTPEEKMREMKVWTLDEFNQFIKCEDNEIFSIYFQTLFWTGARRGEIISLSCNDLDETRKDIFIHTSQRTKKKGRTPPKTGTNRRVTLDDALYSKLLKLKKEYKKEYKESDNKWITKRLNS